MPKYRPMPPLERLNELLEVVEIPPDKYGEWSGLVRKIGRMGGGKAGTVAGSKRPCSKNPDRVNWVVGVDGVTYYASRIIYYMTHEKDPGDAQIDHGDKNWLNNNASNLRLDVTNDVQPVNRPTRRDNTSGVVGVYWDRTRERWAAGVRVNKKNRHLGRFTCKVDAARAVRDKLLELGWHKLGRELPDLNKVQCNCQKHI